MDIVDFGAPDRDGSRPREPLPGAAEPNPRGGLLADLARRCSEAAAAGDLDTARFCNRAMAELLDGSAEGAVVDLALERRRRTS